MSEPKTVKVLDLSRVAPPPPPGSEISLPRLKQSLALTLRHFFPFAANLICPPPPNEPYIFYKEGDSVPFTVAESDADFNHLITNHARDAEEFHSLVAKLPFACVSSDLTHVVPVMAVQVTVFPNSGISIGVTFIHVAADGSSFNHFMKSWTSIYKSGGGDLTSLSLPYHNKDLIKDPDGLSSAFLKAWWNWENLGSAATVPEDNVRVTLVLNRGQIEKLKQLVMSTRSISDDETGPLRVSTYAVTCAFMWVNLIKLQESEISAHLHDNLVYHFISVSDCRERFELPVPATYFGNCLAWFFVPAKRSQLMGENGIAFAAKAIGRTIYELKKGPFIGAEKWVSDLKEMLKQGRTVSVAGSPRLLVYETDFGWGRPKKTESVHIGAYGSFSLAESRDEEGGVEIGLVICRDKLDVFHTIFEQ
ncbi:putative Anthocyanin 5-aromatic acyltransferase [Melia azedarach]|uniref:Anthocyanin 5-aromatic acyltransferase n=1 Tax=Melia azedarach TaxID=155640 RepID=A0ACC1Z3U3_MELAZ|nr:putative Anthocyanin 5-aromatic acyltransferase [Melia azedarach]